MGPPGRPAPDLADAYDQARGTLAGVLARLARQGYPLSPADGLDLIHAFVVDHWERLRETYDPDAGPLEPYLAVAFERFARRESLRRRRLQARLLDPDSLESLVADVPEPDRQADIALVRDVLDAVPDEVRIPIAAFFEHGSERDAAKALGWTRHRFRMALAQSVAHVAVRIGRPPGISQHDWAVTELVLGTGRTADQAARTLGRDPSEVRRTHRATLSSFLGALRA